MDYFLEKSYSIFSLNDNYHTLSQREMASLEQQSNFIFNFLNTCWNEAMVNKFYDSTMSSIIGDSSKFSKLFFPFTHSPNQLLAWNTLVLAR